jgi:hypothetical protein
MIKFKNQEPLIQPNKKEGINLISFSFQVQTLEHWLLIAHP